MMLSRRGALLPTLFALALVLPFAGCGGGYSGGGGGGGGNGNPPATPSGLTATPGNQQVTLSWNASAGAASYTISRALTSGGPFGKLASPTTTSYTDTGLSNGFIYYYEVSGTNSYGTSANSTQ